ncbi:hypothetical protein F2Q70_00014471 [Brassica cretica]|uniref:Uncharacterized protein n=1 Tax=Brassica cretica TaxID=69181 RepID=A0A8S9HY74_BRACR|nr:hypothetical protein F2Q70_00014471 [Brassica cretica]
MGASRKLQGEIDRVLKKVASPTMTPYDLFVFSDMENLIVHKLRIQSASYEQSLVDSEKWRGLRSVRKRPRQKPSLSKDWVSNLKLIQKRKQSQRHKRLVEQCADSPLISCAVSVTKFRNLFESASYEQSLVDSEKWRGLRSVRKRPRQKPSLRKDWVSNLKLTQKRKQSQRHKRLVEQCADSPLISCAVSVTKFRNLFERFFCMYWLSLMAFLSD